MPVIGSKAKLNTDDSVRAIQNQNVNITVQHNPNLNNCTTPATVITNTTPRTFDESTADNPVIERDIKLYTSDSLLDDSKSETVSISLSENKIRFGWPLTADMTSEEGNLRFAVRCGAGRLRIFF